jgi:serine/threonine protein phosphatase 1
MRLFGLARKEVPAPPPPTWSVPAGMRIYAVGDVHGRLDLLRDLLAAIEADAAARPSAETHVIMLGDLIDRGPDSAGIVDFFLNTPPAFASIHQLMGNHEEMLLKLIDTPTEELMAHFLRYGGRETFESYDVPQIMLDLPERYPASALLDHIPAAHRAFFRAMGDAIRVGDYLFVHAGIRPDVPLEEQSPSDVRWIRNPFLESAVDHGVIVVHGHTITATPELRANRIGIDTGAYASGTLTALGLEESHRWLIATGG